MNASAEADKYKQIEFDFAKKNRFRKAYDAAVIAKKESFTFDGNEFLTRYAKYLLEYLDMHNKE